MKQRTAVVLDDFVASMLRFTLSSKSAKNREKRHTLAYKETCICHAVDESIIEELTPP